MDTWRNIHNVDMYVLNRKGDPALVSDTVPMTTEHILFTGLTGCVSAIVFLFGLEMKHHGETKEQLVLARSRLDKCESDRTALHVRVASLEEKLKHEHGH